eukprot:TCONS_00000700-protein
MSNRVDNIVITLFSWILLTGLTRSYKGVLRQSNGTDIELRRWYKDLQRCGETFVVTQNQPILFDDETCGYTCLWQDGVPSSSNEVQPGGGLTCENDQNIRQDCNTGGIGSQIDQNKLIQVMTIADLDQEQTLYHLDKKLSRCEFIESSCGKVEYKDASSGTWKNTSLHTCFDISIQHENLSNSTAVLRVTCSDEKRKQMEGQLMKIQMKCHVDDEKKDYQTCFMFKVEGQSLVSEEKEDLEKVCIIPPTVPVTTLGPIISTTLGPIISSTNDPSSDDNDEGVPLYVIIIIIIIIIVILLIVIAIILYCCCYKRKRKSSETKTVNGIENGVLRNTEHHTKTTTIPINTTDNNNSHFNKNKDVSLPENVLDFVFLNEAYENSINTSTTRHDDVINDNDDDDDKFVIPENIEPVCRAPTELQRQFTDEFVVPEHIEPVCRAPTEIQRQFTDEFVIPENVNDVSHVRTNGDNSIDHNKEPLHTSDFDDPFSNIEENPTVETFTNIDKNDKTKLKNYTPTDKQCTDFNPSTSESDNEKPSDNIEINCDGNTDCHGPDTNDFVHVDDKHDITDCKTPFHRHNSIIKDQLFELFGMDSCGNIVCNIYNDNEDGDVFGTDSEPPKSNIQFNLPETDTSTPLKQTEHGFLI